MVDPLIEAAIKTPPAPGIAEVATDTGYRNETMAGCAISASSYVRSLIASANGSAFATTKKALDANRQTDSRASWPPRCGQPPFRVQSVGP